ncbi:MAG: nuclear transport factor 2 family protein [Ardenticatenaceae bacterium]|nr:nuclear transport factor 2 family protein [Ardenticatenaceae bacterium]MCB9444484.1 nuclear transport factor 2 family protein [Ardenticatenaceae bacterium]
MKTEQEIVEAYFEAHNRQDIEAIIALYSEDATFESVDNYVVEGKSALRQLVEYSLALNVKGKAFDYVSKPGQVTFKLIEQNGFFRTLGVDEIHYSSCTMTIHDGLIVSAKVELSQESMEQVEQAPAPFMAWATKENPETLANLMADDESRISKERALGWMALLHEWQAVQV